MKRNLWIHRNIGNGIYSNEKITDRCGFDGCVICRKRLTDLCRSCDKNFVLSENRKNVLEPVWLTMLLMNYRKGSLFNSLDKNCLGIIYKFVVIGFDTLLEDKCRVVTLNCQHKYHRHCFEIWVNKRSLCPLDNSKEIIPIEVLDIDRKLIQGDFKCVTQVTTDESFESRQDRIIQEKEDEKTVPSVISSILKHYKQGYLFEELYNHVCNKYNGRIIIRLTFKKSIEYLLEKEYISRVNVNHFIYNP